MSIDPVLGTDEFDPLLKAISHFHKYPQLLPWVGKGYPSQKRKVLLLAESHYVGRQFSFHLDPSQWYEGADTKAAGESNGIKTRDIIAKGIQSSWRKKEYNLFRNMGDALCKSGIFENRPANIFTEVAFMNYFQRPAQNFGKSLQVHKQDAQVANDVFRAVVCAIQPDVVIFCSSLAARHARYHGVPAFLKEQQILDEYTAHAGMPWWNREAKKYGDRSGKKVFMDFIQDEVLGSKDHS